MRVPARVAIAALLALQAGCHGRIPDHTQVMAFADASGDAKARVERTLHADGSESLHGETLEDFAPQMPVSLRAIEEAELDPNGSLVSADLSLWNTFAQTTLQKRVTFDVANGQVSITRAAGTVTWQVPADAPWLYYPLLSDAAFGLPTVSPLDAWVIARGSEAGEQARFLDFDDLDSRLIPTGLGGATLSAGEDTFHYANGFVDSIDMGALGEVLSRVDVDPGPLFAVAPEETVPAAVVFPDCSLPGPSENFVVESSDGTRIYGQVDLPEQAGPWPWVVFNAGTGGADREEFIGGIPRWTCLAKPLLEAGIAVARYDDRGHGLTGGSLSAVTFRQRSDDAAAVARLVADRADLAPSRLFLLGHSEGVAHVCEAAAAVPQVGGLLLLSGIGTSGAATWVEQSRTVMAGYGMPLPWIEQLESQKEEVVTQIAAGTYPASTYGGYSTEFWRELFAMNGAELAAGAARPTAIFQGGADWQVDPRNASLLAEAVAGAGVEDVTLFEYPGLGHLESRAAAGYPPMGDEYWLPLDWDEGLVGDLVAWVQQR